MTKTQWIAVFLCLAPLLVFSTGACGGGAAGVTTLNGLFAGSYCFFAFSGTSGTPDEANVTWGDVTSDGAGTITGGMFMENENGVISGDMQTPIPYTIDAARAFTLLLGGLPFFSGRITADGKVACLAAVLPGESPGIVLLGRKEGVHSDASLTGLYYFASIIYAHGGGGSDLTLWGSVTFDGGGGGMATTSENDDGVVSGPGMTMLPYAVSADGSLTATFVGEPLSGAILAGGELVVLAGGTTGGSNGTLLVLTKATAGATNALLNGSYMGVGMQAEDAPPPEWTSYLFPASSDGVSMLSFPSSTVNDDGVISSPGGDGGTYSVGPTGLFSWFGASYEGGITASGDFAVCAGIASGGGGTMQLFFFLR